MTRLMDIPDPLALPISAVSGGEKVVVRRGDCTPLWRSLQGNSHASTIWKQGSNWNEMRFQHSPSSWFHLGPGTNLKICRQQSQTGTVGRNRASVLSALFKILQSTDPGPIEHRRSTTISRLEQMWSAICEPE